MLQAETIEFCCNGPVCARVVAQSMSRLVGVELFDSSETFGGKKGVSCV